MNLWGMIRFGITSLLTKDGNGDASRATGRGQGQDFFNRYYPWGYDSRMPLNGRQVLVSPQGGSNLAAIGGRHDNYPPDVDDESWSVMLHNDVAGTWVKLRKDGGVRIEAKKNTLEMKADGSVLLTSGGTPAGTIEITSAGIVKLDGGSVNCNRQGDPVIAASGMATWMFQVANFINGLVPGTVTPGLPPDFGVTDGGSSKVLIPS